MIQAMTCSFVPTSGPGMSFSGPMMMEISEANRRVRPSNSLWERAPVSTVTPPFAPP